MVNDKLYEAVKKLLECKGRYHTELNYKNLKKVFDEETERMGVIDEAIDTLSALLR